MSREVATHELETVCLKNWVSELDCQGGTLHG
jgi:hypothetical protein